ncbi:MAG: WYL domain-containing protein [Clostridiales bacterium]|nr:WYL domain-containing protein [Clostridiales bacterium]
MARTKRQNLKLYFIIELFKKKTDEEHPISISEIIDYLSELDIKAERKSIYRDIEAMRELGYDIIQIHNKRFTYYLANRDFETAELRLLVDAVQASRFITRKKSNELIRKLEALTTDYDARKLSSQVFVTNRIKASNESIYYNVDSIHNAIQENRKISFLYFDWDINKRKVLRRSGEKYVISPWALIWNNENYYMIGYDSEVGMIKHYRVDRMMSIDVCGEKRDGKSDFREIDVAVYARRFFGMYDGELTTVTLSCAKEIANAVIDRFGTETRFRPEDGGKRFEVDVNVAVSPVFYSWVFQFGGDVRIMAPQWAADGLRSMAKEFI